MSSRIYRPVSRQRNLSRYYRVEVSTMRVIRQLLREVFWSYPDYQDSIFDFLEDTNISRYAPRKNSKVCHDVA